MRDIIKRREQFKLKVIGERYVNKEGYTFTIIDYVDKLNCTIEFEKGGVIYNVNRDAFKSNLPKYPNHPYLLNIGYMGFGKYKSKKDGKYTNYYQTWRNMIDRCYSKTTQEKYPSYKGCSVDECWHNFQNYAQWYEKNHVENFHVDKDILIRGNKIYSPDTCCFVPREINSLFTSSGKIGGVYPIGITLNNRGGKEFRAQLNIEGRKVGLGYYDTVEEASYAYKVAKEARIKETAEKWKLQITEQVYQALINYKIAKK